MKYSPFLSCRQASWLITSQQDRALSRWERIGLALHLRICDACPIVIRQIGLLRTSMRDLRDATEAGIEAAD